MTSASLSQGVRFMIPAARFGFVYNPPAIERITQSLGPGFAAQLLYLDSELTAEQLNGTGFIQQILPAEDLARAAESLAERVAKLAPLAVAGMKQLVRGHLDDAAKRATMARCAESEDVQEGLAAMREKRIPVFKGR